MVIAQALVIGLVRTYALAYMIADLGRNADEWGGLIHVNFVFAYMAGDAAQR